MQETTLTKAVITFFNIAILIGLPIMFLWHLKKLKGLLHGTHERKIQGMILALYGLAINCEVPALWSRWKAYYNWHIALPEAAYILNTWDREGHAIYYLVFFLFTIAVTIGKTPKAFDSLTH